MPSPSVLAFAGSARRDSVNKRLIRCAAREVEAAGARVTLVDLADYPMPLYDGDLEASEGLPPSIQRLRDLLLDHQGLLLSCPEYNSAITPLLKNTIDWTTRSPEGGGDLDCYQGKVVSLLSASPGALGGLRGLVTVRSILGNIGCLVLPQQLAVSKADRAFDESGNLSDEATARRLRGQMEGLVATLKRLAGE
jgi:NAD(P)H-dependent FMN reductase